MDAKGFCLKWFLVLLLPLGGAAQGVKLARYDAFLKKHRVEMEPVALLSSSTASLSVTFSAVAADVFVQLKGAGWGATTIDEGEELVFRFSNDSSVSVRSIALQTFEPGVPQSTYKHQYRISQAGVLALSRFELTGIRKYSFKEASDLSVPREAAGRLQRPASIFLSELTKAATVKTLMKIEAKDVYEHIGDSVRFCSKVYRGRTADSLDKTTTVLELQPDFSTPIVHVLIAGDDRAGFGPEPEKAFVDKTVCVTGVLELRANVPCLTVRKKEQLAAADETTAKPNAGGTARPPGKNNP